MAAAAQDEPSPLTGSAAGSAGTTSTVSPPMVGRDVVADSQDEPSHLTMGSAGTGSTDPSTGDSQGESGSSSNSGGTSMATD